MAQFYLDPGRAFPSRYRERYDKSAPFAGTQTYFHPTYYPNGRQPPAVFSAENYSSEQFYDVEHGGKINDCLSSKMSVTYPIYTASPFCDHEDHSEWSGCPIGVIDPTIGPEWARPAQIFATNQFQAAAYKLYMRYHDALYHIEPASLPDMAVFMAELRELDSVFSMIKTYAVDGIALARTIRYLKSRINKVTSLTHRSGANDRLLRELQERLRTAMSSFISWKFGIMAPIRDFAKIVAAFSVYCETIKFEPRKWRGFETFECEVLLGRGMRTECWGRVCPDTGQPKMTGVSKIRGKIGIVADIENQLLGGSFEKAVEVLLIQLGMFPSVESLWELTRLSWLLDYFFRTPVLLAKAEKFAGLGPIKPVVENFTLSFSFTEDVEIYNDCWRNGFAMGPGSVIYHRHYERMTGDVQPLEFIIQMLRRPNTDQTITAVAYALMCMLARAKKL